MVLAQVVEGFHGHVAAQSRPLVVLRMMESEQSPERVMAFFQDPKVSYVA